MVQPTRVRVTMSRGTMPQPGFLSRFLGLTMAAVLLGGALVAAVTFSLIVLPVVLVLGAIAAAYIWWRTRGVRRQFREQMAAMQAEMARQQAGAGHGTSRPGQAGRAPMPGQGVVIEGDDYIHEARPHEPRR